MELRSFIAMLVCLGALSAVSVDAEEWGSTRSFEAPYALGPTSSLTEVTNGCSIAGLCPYAGAIACAPSGWLRLSQQQSPSVSLEGLGDTGVGGACLDINVNQGDTVTVQINDDVAQAVSVAACVDVNGDGVCRQDLGSTDGWFMSQCLSPTQALTFTGTARGRLQVFVLSRLDTALPCAATTGQLAITVDIGTRLPECSDLQDNDGDGFTDYPNDPDCTGPFDDTESPPPIWSGN